MTLRIEPLTTHLANYTGQVHGNLVDTAGTHTSMDLLETGLVIKRTSGWKLLSGQTSRLPENN